MHFRACGNCEYDCCCRCNNYNCYVCKKINGFRRCSADLIGYGIKYACYKCGVQFKCKQLKTTKKQNYSLGTHCPICGSSDDLVCIPSIFQLPKYSKKNMEIWILTKKLICCTFKEHKVKKFSLASIWCGISQNGLDGMLHIDRRVRYMFNIPHKLKDFDEWFEYMKSTIIPENLRNCFLFIA